MNFLSMIESGARAVEHPSHTLLKNSFLETDYWSPLFRPEIELFYENCYHFICSFIDGFYRYSSFTPVFTDGTTSFFIQTYWKFQERTLAAMVGEYPFHEVVYSQSKKPFRTILAPGDLKQNDFLIVSLPFSGDGNLPPNFKRLMEHCEKLDVPVIVDLALLGLSKKTIQMNHYNCIQGFTFSLSKSFTCARHRIGCAFVKEPTWPSNELDKWSYLNLHSVRLGNFLFNHFRVKDMIDICHAQQIEICEALNLTPSMSYIFGTSSNEFHEFNRGLPVNRVCISKIISEQLSQRPKDELIK